MSEYIETLIETVAGHLEINNSNSSKDKNTTHRDTYRDSGVPVIIEKK